MDPLHVTVLGRHNNTNRNGIGGQEAVSLNSFSVNTLLLECLDQKESYNRLLNV